MKIRPLVLIILTISLVSFVVACGKQITENFNQPPTLTVSIPTTTITSTPTPSLTPTATKTPTSTLFPSVQIEPDNITMMKIIRQLPGEIKPAITWTKDGKYIIVGYGNGVYQIDSEDLKLVRDFPIETKLISDRVAFSQDNSLVVVGGNVWNIESGQQLPITYEGHHPVFSQDGQILATWITSDPGSPLASSDIQIIDLINNEEINTIHTQGSLNHGLALHMGKKLLATGGENIELWDLESNEKIKEIPTLDSLIYGLVFSQDGKYLAWIGDQYATIWDVEEQKIFHILSKGSISTSVAFSPDAKFVITGDYDGNLVLFDVQSGVKLQEIQGHNGKIYCISFSPDGKNIATIGIDNKISIIDATDLKVIKQFDGFYNQISDINVPIAYSTEGNLFISWDIYNLLTWEVENGNLLNKINAAGYIVASLSPDNKTVVVNTYNNQELKVWDITNGSLIQDLGKAAHGSVVFIENGKYLLAKDNQFINVYETINWKKLWKVTIPTYGYSQPSFISNITYSQKASLFATQFAGHIVIWDSKTLSIINDLYLPDEYPYQNIRLSPDGKLIAIQCSLDTGIPSTCIFNSNNGYLIKKIPLRFLGNTLGDTLEFSPDGKLLVVGNASTTKYDDIFLTVFDTKWNEIYRINNADGPIIFSPDGKYLAVRNMWGSIDFLGVP